MVDLPTAGVSSKERQEAMARVSMQSPAHLKSFLEASGRKYLVFNALDLVDALQWPDEVAQLMSLITSYRVHRGTLVAGKREEALLDGSTVEIDVYHDEVLSAAEKAELRNQLAE